MRKKYTRSGATIRCPVVRYPVTGIRVPIPGARLHFAEGTPNTEHRTPRLMPSRDRTETKTEAAAEYGGPKHNAEAVSGDAK